MNYIMIFISVFLSVAAQLLLKKGMSNAQISTSFAESTFSGLYSIMTNAFVISGLMAYVASAGVWLVVLSKTDVSKAYPFVGLGFIGTMIFANFFLNEPLTLGKVLGTLLIVCGIILVTK